MRSTIVMPSPPWFSGTSIATTPISTSWSHNPGTRPVSLVHASRKWVALHIHETGACDPTSSHESAGGHFNPNEGEHGFLAADGPHAGDMPNQYVGDDGVMRAQVFNGMVTLKEGDNGIRGRAIVIHAGFDDYRTAPAGGAGDRLACAVIK